ncbi:MAG: hypothetical protein JJE04_20250 [Acidobacteriia bacterium]|nr:hypothetical protein [Terriglobia bacterium]
MAVYRPTYTDQNTGEVKHAAVWWINFTFAGKRVQESTKSKRKTVAVEYEKRRRRDLEQSLAGMSAERPSDRIRSVADVLQPYVDTHHLNHRPSATAFTKSACKNTARLLGSVLLPDLTEDRIKVYIGDRLKERGGANNQC